MANKKSAPVSEVMGQEPEPHFPVEIVALANLKPHPRNYRTHPEDQIIHLMESIRANGIYRPIVTAHDLTILAGHGVALAAQRVGMEVVPIRRLLLDANDARALKLLAGDNEVAHLGQVDDRALADILLQVKAQDASGLLGTGYDDETFAKFILGIDPGEGKSGSELYTSKIVVPTYIPSDSKPRTDELYDEGKTQALIRQIEATPGITEEERHFLTLAAQRHTVLHFNRIADFYAHASPEVQALMEESALVIIDFDRAIELGYVQLSNRLAGFVAEEYGEEDETDGN